MKAFSPEDQSRVSRPFPEGPESAANYSARYILHLRMTSWCSFCSANEGVPPTWRATFFVVQIRYPSRLYSASVFRHLCIAKTRTRTWMDESFLRQLSSTTFSEGRACTASATLT